jgi:hypothetical protein
MLLDFANVSLAKKSTDVSRYLSQQRKLLVTKLIKMVDAPENICRKYLSSEGIRLKKYYVYNLLDCRFEKKLLL